MSTERLSADDWLRKLGRSEYRITITMAGYGADADAAETLLEGFLDKHPETGPVVSQNREADTLSVTFSLKASGQERALKLGQVVWAESGAASGLRPTPALCGLRSSPSRRACQRSGVQTR